MQAAEALSAPLTREDFPDYFAHVHGHEPFAWQVRLLRTVLDEGWGRPIALPTASGKTAVLDVATFALALESSLPADRRRTPRRIALVVDRRIVVDDAYARARRIVNALSSAVDGLPRRVAEALATLGGERPIDCAAMRGGLYREDRWARTPLQPVLLCSTVDQVGSRLLHRGYGLSPRVWPIHAGLLGHDTLIVLDEAHCSQPFLQTLEAVARLRGRAERPLPGPWAAVAMTATPRGSREPFRLTQKERDQPLLAQRLRASKPARLETATRKGDDGLVAHALKALVDPKSGLARPGTTTLVVLNRVKAARALYDELQAPARRARHGDGFECSAILLTGRSRPAERDRVIASCRERILAGRDRAAYATASPLIVVATQCVEVGADLDVDALVSEACPLDSLRQRAGRLDRLGIRGESPALVICRPELAGDPDADALPKELDPVYGEPLTRTWWWLQANARSGAVDLGVAALDELLTRQPPSHPLAAPSTDAPHVFPEYCDLWVQTGPEPAASPDPAVFLHGPQAGPPEVGVVWRADLDPAAPKGWIDVVAMCPPVAGEVMPLPLHVARAWLAGQLVDPGVDLEGAPPSEEDGLEEYGRLVLRWRGPDASSVAVGAEIRPGDTLVVPCEYGGADRMGWTGRVADQPQDLVLAARLAAGRSAILRLHPGITTAFAEVAVPLLGWDAWANWKPDPDAGADAERDLSEPLRASIAVWASAAGDVDLRTTLEALVADGPRIRIAEHPAGEGLVVTGHRRLAPEAGDFSDEDDLSSLAPSGTVALEEHLADVRCWADRIARGVGLPDDLRDCLAMAGHLHDLGKADLRFQAWLHGGDPLKVDRDRLIAKSDRLRTGRASLVARQRAGYPAGGRHELLSVKLAESAPGLLPADPEFRDLVCHLVASHHGHCRPWAPVVVDERPVTVRYRFEGVQLSASSATGLERLDSGVADRFWRLIRRYGWWGLAYLEACLRLADHRASEHPGSPAEELAQ